ncbi:MAG: radical SAM protein [Pseudomonadota bacterium]
MAEDKKKHPFWKGKVLPRLALMVAPFPKNTFCSIDVTNKCNLRCAHCYFYAYKQEDKKELTNEQWLARIEKMQKGKHPFFSCTWVGGEPLLRKDLIAQAKKFFKSNRVVTNGTLPLPNWPDVDFHISVDGTEKLHDQVRGVGSYAKLKKNILEQNQKVILACCLHKGNVECIEPLLEEWKKVAQIKFILFDFFTPIKGVKEELWLDFAQRDKVLNKLFDLKKNKYGDLIGAPLNTFKLMQARHKHKAVGKNCVFVKHGIALDAFGEPKLPCVIGGKADCNRCGCIVPFSIKAWKQPSNLLKEIFT